MGMGRAFVSLPGDASSAFSNPAATGSLDRSEFTAFHTSLFLGTSYDCLALSHPLGILGVFSLSAGRLGTGDFIGRDEYNRPGQTMSSSETQLGLSYGRSLGFGLAVGTTLKGVGQKIGDNAGYGFGLDMGLQYSPPPLRGLTLGVGISDLVQPRIKLLEGEDKYQTDSRFGLAYTRAFSGSFAATGVFEAEKITGRETRMHPGLEAAFLDAYFLRLGYDHDKPTFGAGIAYSFLNLDYAYENIEYFGGSHRLSLGFSFGKSAKAIQQESVARAIETEKAGWQSSLERQKNLDFALNLSRADSLHASGRDQDALAYYQRALAIDETSERAQAMSDTMIELIITGAASSARDQKREELTAKRIESALGHFKAGRYNDAISQYELALEIDPGNKNVSDLLASARKTRIDEIDNIRKSARAYSKNGNHSTAVVEWNRLLALEAADPEAGTSLEFSQNQLRADALTAQAVAAMNDGKYTIAVQYLEQAQVIKPGDKAIKSLLSEAKAKSAPVTGLADIKASSEHWQIYLKGLESYQNSEYKDALESWEALRQYYPNNPDLDKNIDQARQRLSTEGGKP